MPEARKGEPMNREEAVSIIEDRVRVTEYVESSYVDCVDIEALKMAIEALRQPERKKGKEEQESLEDYCSGDCDYCPYKGIRPPWHRVTEPEEFPDNYYCTLFDED